ncbi:hypothetical protein M9H77_23485 [Catharanthus roseus]|uniref:Uncharacterized protein n=1 Tax=Catharanthus roseus TaxID=4058 RepID=A0ACC0AUP1_CATRO|nr:hypothetical protein M9H77_23485 [Catharanthus roseus]
MEEALKNKFEEFEDQGKVSKLFTIFSISKDHSRNNLMVKMAKYGRKCTLLLMVALPLPSPVGFCWAIAKSSHTYRRLYVPPNVDIFNQEFNENFKSLNYRLARKSSVEVLQEKETGPSYASTSQTTPPDYFTPLPPVRRSNHHNQAPY